MKDTRALRSPRVVWPWIFVVLVATSVARAAPPRGSDAEPGDTPVQGCRAKVQGQLTVTPSSIDRWTSVDRRVTFSWSVTVPSGCSVPLTIVLSPGSDPLPRSGTVQKVVHATRTYQLNVRAPNSVVTLATATVTVQGSPGIVTVSPGAPVTPDDVLKFDAAWMQPYDRAAALGGAAGALFYRYDAAAWGTGERMAALVRMYEITHQRRYLDHLREFVEVALKYRDDNYPGNPDPRCAKCPAKPIDELRGKNQPAWGGVSVNSGGLNRVDEVVSSVYGYPIAGFARIVAEDPALHAAYGSDAVRYANAIIQTMWAFMPQMRYRKAGNFFEAYLAQLDIYKTKPTAGDCQKAYEDEVKAAATDPAFDEKARNRLKQMLANCNNLRKIAGAPMSYNENQAFLMMLIELWRALGSDLYRQSEARLNDAEPTRVLIPTLVARHQRYFVNHLEIRRDNPGGERVFWHHADDVPAGVSHGPEDTSHGALDMRYLDVLRRNFQALNAVAAPRGEPVPLDSALVQRFANTFLQKVLAGSNLAENIDGANSNPLDARNGLCDGWVSLAVADARVYQACHDLSLRVVNGVQPYLSIGNHSALLKTKSVFSRRVPLPVGDVLPPARRER